MSETNSHPTTTGVELQVELLPCLTVAMADSQLALCNRLALVNAYDTDLHDVKVSVGGQHIVPTAVMIDTLHARWTAQLGDLPVKLDWVALQGITEPQTIQVELEARCNDKIIAMSHSQMTILPEDYWTGLEVMPAALAKLVLPQSSGVARVLQLASEHLGQLTGDPAFDNYLTRDPARSRAQLVAIGHAMRQLRLTALPLTEPLGRYRARVRTPRQVVDDQQANPLEMALLLASCLEACGLNALLVLHRTSVMVGVWLNDCYNIDPVSDDSSLLTKAANDDVAQMALIDVAAMVQDDTLTPEKAMSRAQQQLRDPRRDFNCWVDIKSCRLQNIKPSAVLTQAERADDGDLPVVTHDSGHEQQVTGQNQPATTITRQQLWERKLLDFSLRNNLLNMRIGKRVLPFISFCIDQLEDHISRGEEYSLLPSPAQNRLMPDEWGIYDSTLVREQWQELVVNEMRARRLRSYLSETEMVAVLKHIHRTARTALEENGANSLFLALGVLKWFETERSTKPRYAPILMIPVDLVRHAGNKYVIRSRDEETIINVTLIEMIKQQFGLPMDRLTPLPTDESGVDVRQVMATMRSCVMAQPRWDVLDEAMLGLFSFSKYVMWNDIHNHAALLAAHPVVSALASNHTIDIDPNEQAVDARELDKCLPPSEFAIPVDTDSSQFEAIIESGRGKSFVLHGPPGTGKSQTITNMIANALFQGKRVLFVAEKMAALEVVQKRLKAIGIDPFCLELHSNKATKRHVLQQLEVALKSIRNNPLRDYTSTARKLQDEREKLAHYVEAMHARRDAGMSLYECITQYIGIDGDELNQTIDVEKIGPDDITRQEELIRSVEPVVELVGPLSGHPLTGLNVVDATPGGLAHLTVQLTQLQQMAVQVSQDLEQTATVTGLDMGRKPHDVHKLAAICSHLSRLDRLTPQLIDCCLAGNDAKVVQQINLIGQRYSHRLLAMKYLNESGLALNATELQARLYDIETKWWLPRWLERYRFKKMMAPHLASNHVTDYHELLSQLAQFQELDAKSSPVWQQLDDLFAVSIDHNNPDLLTLNNILTNTRELIRYIQDTCTPSQCGGVIGALKLLSANPTAVLTHRALLTQMTHDAEAFCEMLQQIHEIEPQVLDKCDIDALQQWLMQAAPNVATQGRNWKQWSDCRKRLESENLMGVVAQLESDQPSGQVLMAWRKALYHQLAQHMLDHDSQLSSFAGIIFESAIANFRKLDSKFQQLTMAELSNRLNNQLASSLYLPQLNAQKSYLLRNIANHGRGQSVRNIMDQVGELLHYLCPCMLMSPISVAQFLSPDQKPFDMVIFDEASQMPTSEAVGAIARGRSLIVVGDPKQMPPTNFFNVNQVDEAEQAIDDLDSVLNDTISLAFPSKHLRWHYRSRHESLIAFSNSQYYDGRLITFPSVDDRNTRVQFVPVQGVYDYGRSRSNQAEAQAIVAEVLRRLRDPQLRQRSLGIVAFSIAQQNLIDDMLMDALALNPDLEQVAMHGDEPIFVKNLENVQGDERDVILFSIGYGPDANGKVSMNFGPLNNSGGERRLNVAVSRARYEMMVFSTLMPEQIDLNRSKSLGVQGLKMFLEYARNGQVVYQTQPQNTPVNVMASQLADVLTQQGYQVATNVGRSKFKIDLAVIDPNDPGKYLMAVMCDGKGYSDTKTVRDREVCQPTVLAGLGWNIVRVWLVDWYFDRARAIERVLDRLHEIERKAHNTTHGTARQAVQSTTRPERQPQTPIQVSEPEQTSDTPADKPVKQPTEMPVEKPAENTTKILVEKPEEKSAEKPVKPQQAKKSSSGTTARTIIIDDSKLPDPAQQPYVEAAIEAEEKGGVLLMTTRPTKTMAQMRAILKSEQPITFHYACKRMCRIWGVRNANERVTRYVTWLLKQTAKPDPGAPQKVPYYWDNENLRYTYRGFRIKSGREWHDIPLVEIQNAILAMLNSQQSIDEANMARKVSELFGINKCVSLFHEQVAEALTQLVGQSRIKHSDGVYAPRSSKRKSS